MAPARASLYAESRYSSPSGSRSSSRRRPELPERLMYSAPGPGSTRGKQASTPSTSKWLGESASESDSADSPMRGEDAPEPEANGVAITPRTHPQPPTEGDLDVNAKGLGIAFSWSDR
ncbi:hypothetical protein FB451DRAFT_1556359 [Mycena latifolia]|nr:hypothetical protein FB451DRAFT_1556359 [Mycena latifolia]